MDVIDITDSADIADIASHDASWIADLRTVVVTEPDERVAARHLWAMLDRRRVDAAVAAPVVDLRRHRGRRAVAAATLTGVMMASGLGLAAAGQLPAPLQRVAAAAARPFGLRLDPQRPPAHRRSPPPPDQSANSSETTTSGAPGLFPDPNSPGTSGAGAVLGAETGTGGGRSATAPGFRPARIKGDRPPLWVIPTPAAQQVRCAARPDWPAPGAGECGCGRSRVRPWGDDDDGAGEGTLEQHRGLSIGHAVTGRRRLVRRNGRRGQRMAEGRIEVARPSDWVTDGCPESDGPPPRPASNGGPRGGPGRVRPAVAGLLHARDGDLQRRGGLQRQGIHHAGRPGGGPIRRHGSHRSVHDVANCGGLTWAQMVQSVAVKRSAGSATTSDVCVALVTGSGAAQSAIDSSHTTAGGTSPCWVDASADASQQGAGHDHSPATTSTSWSATSPSV